MRKHREMQSGAVELARHDATDARWYIRNVVVALKHCEEHRAVRDVVHKRLRVAGGAHRDQIGGRLNAERKARRAMHVAHLQQVVVVEDHLVHACPVLVADAIAVWSQREMRACQVRMVDL